VIVFYSLNKPETFRIAPPLIISREQIDRAVAVLDESVGVAGALVAEVEQKAETR